MHSVRAWERWSSVKWEAHRSSPSSMNGQVSRVAAARLAMNPASAGGGGGREKMGGGRCQARVVSPTKVVRLAGRDVVNGVLELVPRVLERRHHDQITFCLVARSVVTDGHNISIGHAVIE